MRGTGDTNLDLISQAPLEMVLFQVKKIHLSPRVRAWLVRTTVSGWEQQLEEWKTSPLGFGDRENHRARHRLRSPDRRKALSSGRKFPPKPKPLSSVCWTHGPGDGLEVEAPSPTLTYLLLLSPSLTGVCHIVIWNSNLTGCAGGFPSQSGTATHFTDKETGARWLKGFPQGHTAVGEPGRASSDVQQVANPLSKTLCFWAPTSPAWLSMPTPSEH